MEKEVVVDDMWTPYKELQRTVENAISSPTQESYDEMVKILQRHRQNFLTLLKNPCKDVNHREELNKGCTEGLDLHNVGHTVLPKELVTEAIILSDMYDLNEYMALDLLGTAQVQMANYPGLSRGVVAILLYYDGRKSLVWTLRTLAEARQGNLWTVDTSPQVLNFITNYMDQLIADGLINKILGLIDSLNLAKELELLQRNRALGPARYHQQVVDLFQTTRAALADVIFIYTAQSGLPKEPAMGLLNYLRKMKPEEVPKGGIDNISMSLMMSFLYVLDLSLLHKEDGEVVQKRVALVSKGDDGQFLSELQKEFAESNSENCPWADPGLHSLAMFAWALTISNLRLAPTLIPKNVNLDNPDIVMENAIGKKVFTYLNNVFLKSECLYKEQEFYLRRIHTLFTDFIIQMPQKVKEMRLKAEETDRTIKAYIGGGIEPPKTLECHFEQVLLSMATFYSSDKMKLQLGLDYWYKASDFQASSFPYKTQHKQSILFNFIVASGEGLLMMLFVPYIKLLTALSMFPKGAQQCYVYLRDNPEGVLKPPSWTHFFNTLNRYLNNLKQETLPATDTFYRQRNYTKGITPQELEGLYTVLDLIKTVAGNDISRGEALCQNSRWSCLSVLIGLLSCPLELKLKAKILETLSAFAHSPITCTNLWQAIEAAQVIPTLNTTSAYYPKGIQTDIEEGESRAEEYPVSKAWMQLLTALTAKSIPRLLGAPDRTPGFDPYLHFTIQYILLRLSSRRYKESKEKWEVCEAGMGLLAQLLLQYEPSMPDETSSQVNPLPGYHIMVSLNSQTELLRLMLDIVDEGTHLLESYTDFEGKESLERSLLSILKCLQHSLAHQQSLMSKLSTSNSLLLLPGLSKLILAVNPNSNKPDHLLNIAKFVMFGGWEEKNAAVSVLRLAGESGPTPRSHLLALLTSTPALRVNMRHAFVCLLESEDTSTLVSKTKLAVSKLLLQSLSHGVPNIAHYLFGFDLNKEIKKTVFEQPGVLGMPRTCLHSIMSQLNASLQYRGEVSPLVLESFYRLIHALAANPKTSEPVLRFLRSTDFLRTHLAALPFTNAPTGYEMNQMAWLLKTVAIEMRVTASSKQLSQLCSLVQTFTGDGSGTQDPSATLSHKDHLILQLIKSVDFRIEPPPLPKLDYFDQELLEKALSNCEVQEGKLKLVDSIQVRSLLETNFAVVKAKSSSTQRNLLQQEMQAILTYVEDLNERKRFTEASVHFLDGWRQATEVMLSTATADALSPHRRINLIVDIIHTLLSKAGSSVEPEVGVLVSNCILLLSVDLRQLCGGGNVAGAESADVTLDDTTAQLNLVLDSNLHKLTSIISNLVKWILSSGSCTQKVRVNLYCGLVNLVQVGGVEMIGGVSRDTSQYVSMLDRTRTGRHPALDTLLAFKDRLLDMLCHDSAIGHDISKMVALSVLDMIVSKESQASWAGLLSSRGYFKFLIESLMSSDNELTALLSFNCKSLRPLYVYESKMALLCRVASTETGAELLLEQNVLSCLSALSVFNKHPDIAPSIPLRSVDEDEFIPTVSSRYLQILSPVLYLCDALLSTLGVDNHAAVSQVIKFIVGQGETMSQVLRSGSPYHPLPFLKELSQVTGVIARATNQQVPNEEAAGLEDGGGQARFHRFKSLMLALISRFVISESLFKEIESEARHKPNPASPASQRAPVLTFLQISSHLVLYARNLVSSSHSDRRICNVIFEPALSEASRHSYDRRENTMSLQEATLGVIVQQLGQAVAHHQREKGNLDMAVRKLKSLPDMATSALKQMLPEPLANIMEVEECRRAAGRILAEQIDVKQKEIDYCYFIIEHCLFIIWAHLDYYMLVGLPAKIFGLPKNTKQLAPSMEYDVTWSVTVEDINHLKQGLLSVFNDTFSKTLISTAQDMPASDKGFLEALLRRIQKLIQFAPNS